MRTQTSRWYDTLTDIIHNEDCIKTMSKMHDNTIDLTVTSPPYDNLRSYNGNNTIDFEKIANELYRVTKDGGVVVWIVGDQTHNFSESGTSFTQALYFKSIGFNLFDTMIYEKPPRGAVGNIRSYWKTFEYMFVFSKGNPKTINLIKDRKNKEVLGKNRGTRRNHDGSLKKIERAGYGPTGRRTNIWRYNIGYNHSATDMIAYQHPAIFPESLAHDHIYSWSNPGDLVYDPFMGSGTTAKMAIKLKRRYTGSEINKEYCGISTDRLFAYKKTLINGGNVD